MPQYLLQLRMQWFGTIFGVRGDMGVVRYHRIIIVTGEESSFNAHWKKEHDLTWRYLLFIRVLLGMCQVNPMQLRPLYLCSGYRYSIG